MDWSKLTHLQLGKYGEYFAKMEFAKRGFDIYSAEVDDKGIDFVIRDPAGTYTEVQVKSVRNGNYVFMRKEVFAPRKNFYLALVSFGDDKTAVGFIPSLEWKKSNKPQFLFDRDYKGKRSKPEFGISPSKQYLPEIEARYPLPRVEKRVGDKRMKHLKHD